tara:strand:+ start:1549 stop:1998 length:450 start_codon:yes stop_codon:yes gene_type:complete
MIDEKIKLRGDVAIVLSNASGEVKETREIKNLVVTTGLGFICSRMAGTSSGVMSHMGLGSGSTAASASDTDLGSILGSREALDSSTASANTIQYIASYSQGSATGAVTEAGIFNASSSGTMLCRTVFPVINKSSDDTISVTWLLTLSAS